MQTTHRVVVGDARDLDLEDDSVELVVTSPPYPMIEMWDETFAALDPAVDERLDAGDGMGAFRLMHDVLGAVWEEVARVVAPNGVVCVNVGDATRSVNGEFRSYPNHAAVTDWFVEHGFSPLPDVLWRKPTNSAAKFMGSGMLPPNAYVTLEHEYVLVFRNGGTRSPDPDRRYRSAYFWEERNEWFSDVWTDVQGREQALDGAARDRTAAFPLAIPYRLVNMYSVQGDTVLDPFWGTGTTTLAAMASGRSSVGYEREPDLLAAFEDEVAGVRELAADVNGDRLAAHRAFVEQRREQGDDLGYTAEQYGFPVMTKQERRIRLPSVESVRRTGEREWVVEHGVFGGA
ncbi:DNA-methyltransferase [Halobacteriaceae archaeon GCM10025711]